jgi:hypothetical protein
MLILPLALPLTLIAAFADPPLPLPEPKAGSFFEPHQITQQLIAKCQINPAFVAVERDVEGLARVETSPTLTPTDGQCVYQALEDWDVKTDRPPPVEVQPSGH